MKLASFGVKLAHPKSGFQGSGKSIASMLALCTCKVSGTTLLEADVLSAVDRLTSEMRGDIHFTGVEVDNTGRCCELVNV
jgi:hypothetical protein